MNATETTSPEISDAVGPISVLIIDDSIHDYRTLTVMIRSHADNRYEFEWARNSEEGEHKLDEGSYDLVAVDYNLGLENGAEVVARLSTLFTDPAYLLVTGNQDPEIYREGIKAGAANFVQKTKECGIIFDRTAQYAIERKRFENSLKIANASKDWLMSLLETDLANPLFALNQLLSTASKEGSNMPKEMLVEMIETAYNTSCEAIVATNELLDWGRSVHGAMQPTLNMVNISACIQRAIHLLTTVADERSIYIARKGVFDFKAYCDERMLATVVRNLISAAINYSNEGETIYVESEVKAGNLNLSIRGVGRFINSRDFASLCKPTHDDRPNNGPGDRQALCSIQVASHMLDSMGTNLDIRNIGKEGVRFGFSLPLSLPVSTNK